MISGEHTPFLRNLRQMLVVSLLGLPIAVSLEAQVQMLDDFEVLQGWKPIHTHGEGSAIVLRSDRGRTGKAMLIDYAFMGYMGGVMASKGFPMTLPPDYQFVFDIRGEAPANNLEFRLVDSLGNVWWFNKFDYTIPATWTTLRIKKRQIPYAWGPSWGGDVVRLARIEINIAATAGGKGKVWIDNLRLETLDERSSQPFLAGATGSSSGKAVKVQIGGDGKSVVGWRDPSDKGAWLSMQLERQSGTGGTIITWDSLDYATDFDLQTSLDGKKWTTVTSVRDACGGREVVPTGEQEAGHLRLLMKKSSRGKGYSIRSLAMKGAEFSASPNALFAALAPEAPKGFYPKYLLDAQSYWTLIGTSGDTREALMNEQGMIETDRRGFSLEPFLMIDSTLITWHDVRTVPSLDAGYLPIPSVQWRYRDDIQLTITGLSWGKAERSTLVVRYAVTNTGATPQSGALFVALRPFQVNPPWQVFTIVGGAARIDSVRCGDVVHVNQKEIVPVSAPSACGAATLAQGEVTRFLSTGTVPPRDHIRDQYGHGSAALRYDWNLGVGETTDFVLAMPFHPPGARIDRRQPGAFFDRAYREAVNFWKGRLDNVHITLPAQARDVVNTIKSNLAYILINRDGPALQPGSRAYERSWMRDGCMIAEALLYMGIDDEVREYIDWYTRFQRGDGFIPCIVDPRGAEAVPEHDSHGQYLYMVMQYFNFTRDTSWLKGKWNNILKTARYIQHLRAQTKTDSIRNGTPDEQATFGLVPRSISHEGYSGNPMHSYWDNFFCLRGIKDAATMAKVLGEERWAAEFHAEADDYRKAIVHSVQQSMRNKKVRDIPGSVELGDEGGLSNTIIVTPVQEVEHVPAEGLQAGWDRFWKDFQARQHNTVQWWAYLPYEWRYVGAFIQTGQKERALELFDQLMLDRRPAAWNQWSESVWKDSSAPKSIGDMPHSWVGSDFIRAVRSMFVYEREGDTTLVIGAGIKEAWVDDSSGVTVKGLPTYYGPLDYMLHSVGDTVEASVSGVFSVPPGGIVVHSPRSRPLKSVLINGERMAPNSRQTAVIRSLPARVTFTY